MKRYDSLALGALLVGQFSTLKNVPWQGKLRKKIQELFRKCEIWDQRASSI
jgi:hypothetical protein